MNDIAKDIEDVAAVGMGMRARLIIAAGIATITLALAVGVAHHFEARGRALERADSLAKEVAQKEADAALLAKHAADMAALKDHYEAIGRKTSEDHDQELAQLRRERDADRAAVDRAGGLRIVAPACPAGGTVAATETTGAGRRDDAGPATVRLPPAVEDGLWRLADDADEVSARLRACQNWIRNNGFYGQENVGNGKLLDRIDAAKNLNGVDGNAN